MKIAHLILAHNNAEQLARLIKRLQCEDAHFYLHIDKKVLIDDFLELRKLKNVFFVDNRVKVYWGSYSIVQATINSFKEIIDSGINYEYINLLSGQDYPIKDTSEIYSFLLENPGMIFMKSLNINTEWQEAITRITRYHVSNYHFRGKHRLEWIINKILPQRKMPNSLIPVGRSQWFTIPLVCAKYILNYLDNNKNVERFFKWTWAPDEMIFQTILYNSEYRNMMAEDNLVYVDWSTNSPHPKVHTINDADTLVNSRKLFARKFNINIDSRILDYLDKINNLGTNNHLQPSI